MQTPCEKKKSLSVGPKIVQATVAEQNKSGRKL